MGDGGVSDTVRDCVTGAVVFAGMVIVKGGLVGQPAPKGKDPVPAPAAAQVMVTAPVNPPLGVTVIGMVTVFAVVPAVAVIVPLPPVMVNVPELVTVKTTLLE